MDEPMRAVGIALLALAAVWPARPRVLRLVGAAAGGAALLAATWQASFEARSNDWAVPATVVLAMGAAWFLPQLDARRGWRLGWRWALLIGGAAAVYGCVPETDQMPEVGVVVAAGLVVELVRRTPLPAAALVGAWGLVAWSALYGATGRPSALVGGLFALAAPIAAGAAARKGWWCSVCVGGAWAVAGLVVARTGGIATELTPAVVAAVAAAAAAGVVSAACWRRLGSPPAVS